MTRPRRFGWQQTRTILEEYGEECALPVEPGGRWFEAEGLRIWPPPRLPIPPGCADARAYLWELPDPEDEPEPELLLMMQAGAVAMGLFCGDELRRSKSDKRYVIRGKGRAQPTHLKTRGKSRYGSRLRLQNHRALLGETQERLWTWQEEEGPWARSWISCPERLWPEFCQQDGGLPFAPEAALKVPLDVPIPTTEVLLDTWRELGRGRIEPSPGG